MNNIILSGIVGSKAYGLDHANSDTDTLGIFVSPTVEVAGLDWHRTKETMSDASPDGDDSTLHEIGKFCRLALQANPTLIELLFLDDYLVVSEEGQRLIDIRDAFLSYTSVRSSYHGYAISQVNRIEKELHYKPKMARHALRIARQGVSLLETGGMDVKIADPQEYFDLTEKPFDEMSSILRSEVEKILTASTVLNTSPDKDTVRDFLEDVRRTNIG